LCPLEGLTPCLIAEKEQKHANDRCQGYNYSEHDRRRHALLADPDLIHETLSLSSAYPVRPNFESTGLLKFADPIIDFIPRLRIAYQKGAICEYALDSGRRIVFGNLRDKIRANLTRPSHFKRSKLRQKEYRPVWKIRPVQRMHRVVGRALHRESCTKLL
jgi:hypothetical protein